MRTPIPIISQERDLADNEAALLWNWILARQGLSASTQFDSLVEMSTASLGLHAARLPSPYSTALARAADPQVAASLFTLPPRRDLVTVRCMRKTLHTLPLPLASAAHAATRHFRERDAHRLIVNAGLTARTISTTTDAVMNLLADRALHHRAIEGRLTSPRRPVAAIRLAVKLAWEQGLLTYTNESGCWNREHRTFALTQQVHPTLDMQADPTTAQRHLITTYFDRYGPATLKDAQWWSGLSRTAILTAMQDSDEQWIQVTAPWSPSPMFMYRHRWDEFTASPPTNDTGPHFLAHEDVALKAYFETRSRYLGSLPARDAFNQIGEALPTIMLQGQVVGTWTWQGPRAPLVYTFARGRTTPQQRRVIIARAATVQDALRRAFSPNARPAAEDQLALL